MNPIAHNRHAWNHGPMSQGIWAQPVNAETIARARAGDWQVVLTPTKPVPRDWLGDLRGQSVLCLASGGGQQAPILAAAGARVLSFDLSDEQLRKDQRVAEREGLDLQCVQGDMADLRCLPDQHFDLVFHPASNVFAPDLAPVWQGCHRVLRPGGRLLAGFMNPAVFLFDHAACEASGVLTVSHRLPYSDIGSLAPGALQARIDAQEPLEYSHSLAAQIGGQAEAGLCITGLYEDGWIDDTWLLAHHTPICLATRAQRPPIPA